MLTAGYAANLDTPEGLPDSLVETIEDSAGAGLAIAEEAPVGGDELAGSIRSAFEQGTADAMKLAGFVTVAASGLVAVIGPRGRRSEDADAKATSAAAAEAPEDTPA